MSDREEGRVSMGRKQYERGISYDDERQLYYLYIDLGRDENGDRQRRYRTFRTLAEARKVQKDILAQKTRATLLVPSDLTLDQWLGRWMDEIVIPNRAETTAYGYQRIIQNHISPALGSIPLQKLSSRDLQHYYAELLRTTGLSANTVRRHHDLLSAALHAAQRLDLILRSPTERVEPPRVVHKETRYYTSDTLKRLYELAEGSHLEVAIHLAGSLGLRREEICGLRWENVDFQLHKLHICTARTTAGGRIIEKETKNRSSTRTLHMEEAIEGLLRREARRQQDRKQFLGAAWPDSGLVLVDESGVPVSPNVLSVSFTRFIRANGLPPITLHGLRHTFATVASAQGAPLFDIGKALGHSTPATTGRIYTHLSDQLHRDTLDRVAAALK
jgi:integrase